MTAHLTLVPAHPDESRERTRRSPNWSRAAWVPPLRLQRGLLERVLDHLRMPRWRRPARVVTELRRDDAGAVTAEYVVVVMAAVAFAGLLVAILRSSEIRQMLVDLVQNALSAAS